MFYWLDSTGAGVRAMSNVRFGQLVIGPDSTVLVPSPEGFLQIIE